MLILEPGCQHLYFSTTLVEEEPDHELRFLPLFAAIEPATPAATTASTARRQSMILQKIMNLEVTAMFFPKKRCFDFDSWECGSVLYECFS